MKSSKKSVACYEPVATAHANKCSSETFETRSQRLYTPVLAYAIVCLLDDLPPHIDAGKDITKIHRAVSALIRTVVRFDQAERQP